MRQVSRGTCAESTLRPNPNKACECQCKCEMTLALQIRNTEHPNPNAHDRTHVNAQAHTPAAAPARACCTCPRVQQACSPTRTNASTRGRTNASRPRPRVPTQQSAVGPPGRQERPLRGDGVTGDTPSYECNKACVVSHARDQQGMRSVSKLQNHKCVCVLSAQSISCISCP